MRDEARAASSATARRGGDNNRIARIAAALAAARGHDGNHAALIGYLELYCERSACPVREVEVRVKEYDNLTPATLRCPACRAQLKLHHARTLHEQIREEEAAARSSVNAQVYVQRERRRLGDPDAPVAVPLGVFLDDSLAGGEA